MRNYRFYHGIIRQFTFSPAIILCADWICSIVKECIQISTISVVFEHILADTSQRPASQIRTECSDHRNSPDVTTNLIFFNFKSCANCATSIYRNSTSSSCWIIFRIIVGQNIIRNRSRRIIPCNGNSISVISHGISVN